MYAMNRNMRTRLLLSSIVWLSPCLLVSLSPCLPVSASASDDIIDGSQRGSQTIRTSASWTP